MGPLMVTLFIFMTDNLWLSSFLIILNRSLSPYLHEDTVYIQLISVIYSCFQFYFYFNDTFINSLRILCTIFRSLPSPTTCPILRSLPTPNRIPPHPPSLPSPTNLPNLEISPYSQSSGPTTHGNGTCSAVWLTYQGSHHYRKLTFPLPAATQGQ